MYYTFGIILIIDSMCCLCLVVGFVITVWSKWQENVTIYQQCLVTHFRNVMQFQMFETFKSVIRSILHLDPENFLQFVCKMQPPCGMASHSVPALPCCPQPERKWNLLQEIEQESCETQRSFIWLINWEGEIVSVKQCLGCCFNSPSYTNFDYS